MFKNFWWRQRRTRSNHVAAQYPNLKPRMPGLTATR